MKNRISRGFTFVEVLITLAIVAILGAIAAPAYSSYLDKLLLVEAVTLGASLKAEVAEQYVITGKFPSTTSYSETVDDSDVVSSYSYWSPDSWQSSTEPAIWIHVYLKAGVYTGATKVNAIILEGIGGVDGSIQWTCGAHPGSRNIPAEYLPSGCDETLPYP